MDSFYDAPRRAPAPVAAQRILPTTVVPEVSLLFGEQSTQNIPNNSLYSAWKIKNAQPQCPNSRSSNKENTNMGLYNQNNKCNSSQNTSQMLKKQVRFESPVLQQRPSLTYEPFLPKNDLCNSPSRPQTNEKNISAIKPSMGTLQGKTFEQIYMANVPNRHLDLSIIDPPVNNKKTVNNFANDLAIPEKKTEESKEKELPKTYKEFLETQKKIEQTTDNDCVTDIYSYIKNKSNTPTRQNEEKACFSWKPETPGLKKTHKIVQSKNDIQNSPNKINCNIFPDRETINSDVSSNGKPNYEYCFNSQSNRKEEMLNLKHNDTVSQNNQYLFPNRMQAYQPTPKCDNVTQTSTVFLKPAEVVKETPKEDEPTVKDLLKIISQQNEQLLLLQKQVASLMDRDQMQKQIEAPPRIHQEVNSKDYVTSTQHENIASGVNNTPRKRGLPKFSIDLMTSFEVSFRPQNKHKEYINYEPKIQELTETESTVTNENDKKCVDSSMQFQEPLKVRESCPSPEPSVKINDFEDYESSDEETTTSEIGATFYKNLMSQVNNLLQKAQIQTKDDLGNGRNSGGSEKATCKTMKKVKEATLKHLKSIGVSLPPNAEESVDSQGSEDGKEYNPKELSFAVKQLLMKYLPDEHLAKITYKQTETVPVDVANGPGLIPNRPEFSFATLQYMKKYNLIANNDKRVPENNRHRAVTRLQNGDNPKILDISALKQQPKLL